MVLASWVALLLGGLLAGLGPVGVMVWPKRFEKPAVALSLLAGAFSAAGLVGISVLGGRVDEAVVAGFLGVAAALGGFALGGALLAQIAAEPEPASLPDPLPPAVPGTAVILLADAEPERYTPEAVAGELRDLSDGGVQLPPEAMRAFIFASEKSRYAAIHQSPARETSRLVAASLNDLLEGEDDFTGVTLAWASSPPTLDDALVTIAGRGVRGFIIAQLAAGSGFAITRAAQRVDALRRSQPGIRVAYAETLWSSSRLAERLADRIVAELSGTDLSQAGVALLGFGQPPEFDEIDTARTEHETFLNQRVRAMLVERGLDEGHVRLGWAEWQEPGVTEVVRHLAALGCRRIVVAPSVMPTESRTTLIDIPDAITQARVEKTAEVVVLSAWGDDPVVAEALAEKVRAAAAEL
jgi:protoheme ferro-lyase